ncbi:MAG: pyruvate ferredoxin oxidoreductase [Candidatus Moranbacteria bacterium]|jgi:pyruvate ferredoxin oxidoreductase alpha subunit|nr:pyruvate ferredoxin oxidoreductase [Candidatus Moranbacteria bacterium]
MNKKNKMEALTGGHAVGQALSQIDPDVMAVYPITPQTPIVEYFAKKKANGQVATEIIPVESEHSAMSACIGASACGARTVTASSSQGIMYMMETLPIAAAMRLPIVMAVANRAISGPINIHADHSDAMAMREYGWIQLFSESVQEAYDNAVLAFKVAEKAMLPLAVNMDGFITSHSVENLEMINPSIIKKFVGKYNPKQTLFDFSKPKTFGPLALQNSYFEFRKEIFESMEDVRGIFNQVTVDFEKISGRKYGSIEKYKLTKAKKVIIAMGSVCGTIKEALDSIHNEREKTGLIKVRLFRPFPYKEIREAAREIKEVIVLDRNLVFGAKQVLAGEVEAAIGRPVTSIVYGLGGRDVFEKQIIDVIRGKHNNQFLM